MARTARDSADDRPFDVVAVVPIARGARMLAAGWRPGRATMHVCTVVQRYANEEEAMQAARRLTAVVWTVERAEA